MHQLANPPAECEECQKPIPPYARGVEKEVAVVLAFRANEHARAVADALYAAAVEAFGENPIAGILTANWEAKTNRAAMRMRDALRRQMEGRPCT